MIRNDGIGSLPGCRVARNVAALTASPGRPPTPKRNPGESDIARDLRFRLTGARAVAPAPAGALDDAHHSRRRSPELEQAIRHANATARSHIPNRTTGECTPCDGIVSPGQPAIRSRGEG